MGPIVAQSLAALIANLTMFSAGMLFGWLSPSIPKLLDPDDENDLKLTPDEASWAVSMTSFGCVFGPIILNSFVDRIGRKWSLKLAVMPMLVSWLIMGLAESAEGVYVSRFMGGLSLGAGYALLPMYIREIAEDRIRGALGTLMTTSVTAGVLISYCLGPWISLKMLCVASAVPPLLFLGRSPWMPETPYFLLMKGDPANVHLTVILYCPEPLLSLLMPSFHVYCITASNIVDRIDNSSNVMGPIVAQGLAALIATLTMLSAGMVVGWASPSLPKLLDPDNEDDLKLTPDEASWCVSITSIGCMFGPIIFNSFVDRIGRKWSLKLAVMPMLISWLIMGVTNSAEGLYVGRFMGGLSLGAGYALLPMYLGEIAENRIRGGLGTLMTTSITAGAVLSYSLSPWISLKMLYVASAVPPLLFLCLSPWLPETPYFLLMKGDNEKAHASLAWLRGRTYVDEEIASLKTNVTEQQKFRDEFGIAKLFRSRVNRRALGITFGLLTAQQLSGIVPIIAYGSLIFESSGLTGWTELSVVIMGVVDLCVGISVIFIVDSVGRRPTLIVSSIMTSLSLTCEAVFFHLKFIGYDTSSFSWMPFLGIVVFYLSFIPGLATVPHAMIGELFPINVKAPATMFLSVYGSTMAAIVSKVYQVAGEAVGTHSVFYFFAATALAGAIFTYIFVPETKKLSLQAIQENLHSDTISSKNALSD